MSYGFTNYTEDFPIGLDYDIKTSVYHTLYGSDGESAKGEWIILQRLVRDDNGEPIRGTVYKNTQEGSNSNRGPATTRTGYICNEVWIRGLIIPSGRFALNEVTSPIGALETNRVVIITAAQDKILQHDVMILPARDEDDNIASPVTIESEYNATLVYPKRLDNGRLEYHLTICENQK